MTRDTLRAPFAVQAFLISPLVIMLAIASMLMRHVADGDRVAGVLLFALIWYVWARISTYHALTESGWLLSATVVCVNFAGSTAVLLTLWALLLR